jgi:hypothetical protein
MWRLLAAGALAIIAISAPQALAASDTALRAIYCLPVLDRELALARKALPELTRSLRPELRQKAISDGAKLDNLLATSRERLRVYALTNADLDQPIALLTARRGGEIDAAQCDAEVQPQSFLSCAHPCSQKCALGEISCVQQCYSACGLPTCARIAACINPSWLPY